MKFFVVSLHRSGTQSVTALLEDLGIKTVHWPRTLGNVVLEERIAGQELDLEHVTEAIAPVLSTCQAAADVPISVLYKQLYRRYPEAKFILLFRDPFDWIRSVRGHIGVRAFDPFERVQYWHYLDHRPKHMDAVTDHELFAMYCRHSAEVSDFFHRRAPDRLGVFSLDDTDSGRKIASFLGYHSKFALPHIGHGRRPGFSGRVVHRLRYFWQRQRPRLLGGHPR